VKRHMLSVLGLLFVLLSAPLFAIVQQDMPNIVAMLTDNLGYSKLGVCNHIQAPQGQLTTLCKICKSFNIK